MNTKIRHKKITFLHIIYKKTCLSSSYNHKNVCVRNFHIVLYFPFLNLKYIASAISFITRS